MNLARLLLRIARSDPGRPALLLGERLVCDYGGLAARVAARAGVLRDVHGLGPGDRVALHLDNGTGFLEALYAVWWAGLVAVPINSKLHPSEAAWIIDDAAAALVFTEAGRCEALGRHLQGGARVLDVQARSAPRDGGPAWPVTRAGDDLAWLFYTSGTTGRPKGVMLSHGNLMAMTWCYLSDVDPAPAAGATLYAAPMSHGAGLYSMAHMLVGARHVVPESGGFEPDEILALSRGLRDVSMFAAPTMVRRLVDACERQGRPPEGLETIVYGGGPMYVEDILRALAVMGPRFVQIYGQGESPMTITVLPRAHIADHAHPRHRARLGSVGFAHSAVEVAVVDADGRRLPAGGQGEIVVRGATVMQGYWQRPEASADALRSGWLHTGDVGVLDEDGFLTLMDRAKDLIITGGSNVYPREVEEVLLGHPSVAEVAVVGEPDPEWGESVVACVVPAPGARFDPAALDALCLARMARFKRPRRYLCLATLPKNNYGKVLKTALRQSLKDGGQGAPDAGGR
ncbi:MAG: AMP-binding protein [Rhodocyclaceae bacterium]|nr:AMP-binding protein [Rhodocyclaceae bacterium]